MANPLNDSTNNLPNMGGFSGFGAEDESELMGLMSDYKTPAEKVYDGFINQQNHHSSMMSSLGEGEGPLGMLFNPPKIGTGFVAGKDTSATSEEFNKFTKDFNRKYYMNTADKVKYPTFDDWVQSRETNETGIIEGLEGRKISIKYNPDTGSMAFVGGDNIASAQRLDLAADYKNKDFTDKAFELKHDMTRSDFANIPEFDYLNKYLDTLLKGDYKQRIFLEKPGYGLKKDYEYTGEDFGADSEERELTARQKAIEKKEQAKISESLNPIDVPPFSEYAGNTAAGGGALGSIGRKLATTILQSSIKD